MVVGAKQASLPSSYRLAHIQLAALFFSKSWGQVEDDIELAKCILLKFPALAKERFYWTFAMQELCWGGDEEDEEIKFIYLQPIYHFARATQLNRLTLEEVYNLDPTLLDYKDPEAVFDDPNWHRCLFFSPAMVACCVDNVRSEVISFLLEKSDGILQCRF